MKKKKQWWLCLVMAVLLLCDVILSPGMVYAVENPGTDKTAVLTDFVGTIVQNEQEIEENGTLTNKDPVSVKVSFGVPVEGDEPSPENPVQKGDTATFELSSSFQLLSYEDISLKMGEVTVGHVSLTTNNDTKKVTAHVKFDGDLEVFDGTSHTVACNFDARLQYDEANDAGSVGEHVVSILGKTYTVVVPEPEIDYEVKKSGTVDLTNKTIEWKVQLSALQDGNPIDLKGYKFSDDLKAVGSYVSDSFMLDKVSIKPVWQGESLSYIFPENSMSPQTVTFQTKLPEGDFFTGETKNISNTAQLLNLDDKIVGEGEALVEVRPIWITKTGKSNETETEYYNSKDRTITWSIVANQMEARLQDVVITDFLEEGLLFESASLQMWDGSNWGAKQNIFPNENGEYAIGMIQSKILLTIKTNVPDEKYGLQKKNYPNGASIRWAGLEASQSFTSSDEVGIGYDLLTKSGTLDITKQKITWTVTIDEKNQKIPEVKVYDLLVYGDESEKISLWDEDISGLPEGIIPQRLQYNLKYMEGSFKGDSSLHLTKVYSIKKGEVPVADLLEITVDDGFNKGSFSFDTQVVNPNIFAGNKGIYIRNMAELFSGKEKLTEAYDDVYYQTAVLKKELLKREALTNPIEEVDNRAVYPKDGFDYDEKAAIFRFVINEDNLELSNMVDSKGRKLGKITITDMLPTGWELTDIVDGRKFLLFEGSKGADNAIVASGNSIDSLPGLDSYPKKDGISFTFDSLDKTYVVLIKARPNAETLAQYFSKNQTIIEENILSLTSENWATGIETSQEISITSQILDKSILLSKNGTVEWGVDYQPYELSQKATRIKDSLPSGIDLRMDSKGNLLVEGNITAYEMTLKADGSYEKGEEVPLKIGENLFYDNNTKVLSFLIPDSKKGYHFQYITDVTGDIGEISNQVTLYGEQMEQETTNHPYLISSADGEATLKRNGWIQIVKKDENGSVLAGAEFTIFALDGKTKIRSGVTGNDGTVKLKVIPDGEYILRETKAPEGYRLEETTHTLEVKTLDNVVTSSIDGKTGSDSNKITILNLRENVEGNLSICKKVEGNNADTKKVFDFTVTFADNEESYSYIGNGVSDGTIKSGESISLAHGQSVTIVGIPKGTLYSVSESDYTKEGYTVSNTGATGIILADKTQTAVFTNTKNSVIVGPILQIGNLTIKKTVAGNGADKKKKFEFEIRFQGSGNQISYSYIGDGVADGTIKSGEKILLADGESITITGLLAGISYTVEEADYSAEGYVVSNANATGIVAANAEQMVAFINTKNTSESEPESKPENKPEKEPENKPEPESTVNISDGGVPKEGVEYDKEKGNTTSTNATIKTPKTGDDNRSILWKTGLGCSGVLLFVLILMKWMIIKKQRQKKIIE